MLEIEMKAKLLLGLLLLVLPVIGVAKVQQAGDSNAIAVVGYQVHGVRISGWVHAYSFATPAGVKRHVRYLHAMTPINWYPGKMQPDANIGIHFWPRFHVYDIQLDGAPRADVTKWSAGGRCITVVGVLRANQLHAAPGVGPEALGIIVNKVQPCSNVGAGTLVRNQSVAR